MWCGKDKGMPQTRAARVATTILTVESVGVLALALWEILALLTGDSTSVGSSLALIVLTVIGGSAVTAFAVGVTRDRSWARTGGVVVQLLVLAVALGAVTGAYAHPLIGLALATIGVAGLVPLIFDIRRAGRERSDDGRGDR